MFTDARINAALDALSISTSVKLSVHSDYSATGANICTGSAKTAGTLNAAGSRSRALNAAVDITSIAAGQTVKWIGVWDGTTDTTFLGMVPNGGTDKSFQVDLTNNTIVCEANGYADGDKITFHNDTAPTALTAGTTYFVRDATAADPDTFKVAATAGGAAIDITGQAGSKCRVSKIVEETYAGGGTHRVSTLTIGA